MKFAGFPKVALLPALAVAFALALAGCGSSNNMTLAQGNWSVAAISNGNAVTHNVRTQNGVTPNVPSGTFYVGGNLTQSGSSVTGTMYFFNSCIDPSTPVNFTGSVSGTKVTLTSASVEGEVITVVASGTTTSATSALTGTYTVSGGCDDGDTGTVTATAVAPISGTWAGSLSNCGAGRNGCVNATISIDLTQATAVSADGTFALTGNVTYTNSACSVSGTITGGSVTGQFVMLNVSTLDQNQGNGSFTYGLAQLDSPTTPANTTGTYSVTFGECSDNAQTLTLTKQ
jgi:hypothetical protein